jgi:hypothetical protein
MQTSTLSVLIYFMITTLMWGDPQLHFWLRHTRKAQEPIAFFGADAETITTLLEQQLITAVANPEETRLRRVGMIGLTPGDLSKAGDSATQVALLTTYYQRLLVGGKLVVALALPDMELLGRAVTIGGVTAPIEELPSPHDAVRLYRWRTTHCDPIAQCLRHHDVYETTDREGISIRRWHTQTQEYYSFPNEVRLMLERVGYLIEAGYGGWNDEPLDIHAKIQVWVARKGV